MSGVFSTPSLTPPVLPQTPSITDDSVQRAADDEARRRAARGRASTVLTNPATQRESEASQQQYLGGS